MNKLIEVASTDNLRLYLMIYKWICKHIPDYDHTPNNKFIKPYGIDYDSRFDKFIVTSELFTIIVLSQSDAH